jgi:hypothetical protein
MRLMMAAIAGIQRAVAVDVLGIGAHAQAAARAQDDPGRDSRVPGLAVATLRYKVNARVMLARCNVPYVYGISAQQCLRSFLEE